MYYFSLKEEQDDTVEMPPIYRKNYRFILFSVLLIFSGPLILCSYTYEKPFIYSQLFTGSKGLKWYQTIQNVSAPTYTWKCQEEKCIKAIKDEGEPQTSLETCNMLCGSSINLWPKPTKINFTKLLYSPIYPSSIIFTNSSVGILTKCIDIFRKNIQQMHINNNSNSTSEDNVLVFVNIAIQNVNVSQLKLDTIENYTMTVKEKEYKVIEVDIVADNYFGVRHALETLSQLIWFDSVAQELRIIYGISIEDGPIFPYRGLMVDVARNYFPVSLLKKIIDGMAASKLNVLHLHLTDSQSFPIILPSIKYLSEYGAYSSDRTYSYKTLKNLIEYAKVRGVRTVLEVDAPSHVNAGWNFATHLFNESLLLCDDNIFGGVMNPDNPKALDVLQAIYEDLLSLSENRELIHLGGDEVNLGCWIGTNWYKTHLDKSLAYYINEMINRIIIANQHQLPDYVILWSSHLTDQNTLNLLKGNIVVQSWLGSPLKALRSGYKVIYSSVDHWYLDCGYGPYKPEMNGHGNCDPYKPWQSVYSYRPWTQFGYKDQTLGGEVCLWTEQVEIDDLETRVWPRAAAFAERVWSDNPLWTNYDVYTRLESHRNRLDRRAVKSAALWPRACSQDPLKCGKSFFPDSNF